MKNPLTQQPHEPLVAFQKIGIHNGDDGLDPSLCPKAHKWAADHLGLRIEVSTVQRGHRGVNFLARYYTPDVWYGSTDSMCDVKRQLSKFHTTVRLPDNVSPAMKLREKALSFFMTDAQTPVIGQIACSVNRLAPETNVKYNIGNYWSKFPSDVQYPNNNSGGWMDTEFEHSLPSFDRTLFDSWLNSCTTLEQITQAPLCHEIEPAKPGREDAVVDNTVVPMKVTENTQHKPITVVLKPKTKPNGKAKSHPGRKPSTNGIVGVVESIGRTPSLSPVITRTAKENRTKDAVGTAVKTPLKFTIADLRALG